MVRIPLRLLLAFVLAFLAARAARAGDVEHVPLQRNASGTNPSALRVVVEQLPAQGRDGAYGFVSLLFHNPHPTPQAVSAKLVDRSGGLQQTYARSLVLEPESTTRVHMPIPAAGGWPQLELQGPDGTGGSLGISSLPGADRFAVLGVQAATRTPRSTAWVEAIDAATYKSSRRHSVGTPIWCDAETVPPDWRLLSGFDLIILNAGVADFDAAQQDALARYVAGGGHLVLSGVEGQPEGPLGRMMTSLGEASLHPSGAGEGGHGFGRWRALPGLHPADDQGLVGWLEDEAFHGKRSQRPLFVGGIPSSFRARLSIPGLGEVPVQVFFLLILAFAVFVGPVTYVWLKRRRRLPWLAITIPLTGFLVSGVILLYGFFSEGFGIRGSIRSFTMLDQRSHEAATAAGRTLYAGLSPSALVPAPGTLVTPPLHEPKGRTPVRDVDMNAGGRISGSALPSRTPTPFATMTVGRARERLRFRRREDGTFEVLHGPDFAPVVAAGAVLLRTFDGALFRSDASGRLIPRPMASSLPSPVWNQAVAPLARMRLGNAQVEPMPGRGYWRYGPGSPTITNDGPTGFATWFEALGFDRLPAGAYLARVRGLPSLDSLGLDVDYEAAEHLVLGFLAEEDLVE